MKKKYKPVENFKLSPPDEELLKRLNDLTHITVEKIEKTDHDYNLDIMRVELKILIEEQKKILRDYVKRYLNGKGTPPGI